MNDCLISRLEKRAKILCDKANGRCRHIAFLVRRNKIICYGVNNYDSTHTAAQKYYKYARIHAEFAAINNWTGSSAELRRCDLFVLRVSRETDKLTNSKPCPGCIKLIRGVGIKNVYYSTWNGNINKL